MSLSRYSKIAAITTQNKLWDFREGHLLRGEDACRQLHAKISVFQMLQKNYSQSLKFGQFGSCFYLFVPYRRTSGKYAQIRIRPTQAVT